MEGTFRVKNIVTVCMFLAQFGVSLSSLDSAVLQGTEYSQSIEVTWRIGDFHTEQGYELTNNILRTIKVSDYFDCVTACLAEQRCCSVNYKPDDDMPVCDLNKRCLRKRVKDGCMKSNTKAVYYELSDTRGRNLEGDPCRSTPCLNGGTCSLTESCNGFKCSCHPFNREEHCEKWTDDASDFDLALSYGSSTSFASFDFAQTQYSSETPWPAFTVCFWVKRTNEVASKIALVTYFSTKNKAVFSVLLNTERMEFEDNNTRLLSVKVPELNDKSWHHACSMWENTTGMASLFIDGMMRERVQGKCIGSVVNWNGVLHLGDRTVDGNTFFICSLTCVRLWKRVMTDSEVKMEYNNKKCKNHEFATITWPLLKRAELSGNASWTNSSSLSIEEELDFEAFFPQVSSNDYLAMDSFSFPELSVLTVCLWVRFPAVQPSDMTVLRYSVNGNDAFVIEVKEVSGKLDLTVTMDDEKNGVISVTKVLFKNDFWNHLCFTWSSASGNYEFYINGTVIVRGTLKRYHKIPPNGLLIIGAKKTSAGIEKPFTGDISCLQMWNDRLTDANRIALFEANKCKTLYEPFFNWIDVKTGTPFGSVSWKVPSSITKPEKAVSEEDYDAVYPDRSKDGYIMMDSLPELSALSVSLWAKSDSCTGKHTLMVYYTGDGETEILIRLEKTLLSLPGCKLSIFMKDVELMSLTSNAVLGWTDSVWHFVAFKWRSSSGEFSIWLDAVKHVGIKFEGKKISQGYILIGEQEENDADSKHRFVGRITCLQMWKISLADESVTALYNTQRSQDEACYTVKDSYSLLTWAQIKTAKAKGEVSLYSPSGLIRR